MFSVSNAFATLTEVEYADGGLGVADGGLGVGAILQARPPEKVRLHCWYYDIATGVAERIDEPGICTILGLPLYDQGQEALSDDTKLANGCRPYC